MNTHFCISRILDKNKISPRAILPPAAKKAPMTRTVLSDQPVPASGVQRRGTRPMVTRPQGQAMSTQDIRPVVRAGTRAVGMNTSSWTNQKRISGHMISIDQ